VSERVVSRVFASQTGDDGFGHVVRDGLVSYRMPVIATKCGAPVPELRIRVVGLADAGDNPRGNERRVIELSCVASQNFCRKDNG